MQQMNSYVPPPSQLPAIIALVISSLALLLSVVSLYLQRRDKRPRLTLSLKRKLIQLEDSQTDERRFFKTKQADAVEIQAANPTDKEISVVSIEFKPRRTDAFSVLDYNRMEEIPSHERRTGLILVSHLNDALLERELSHVSQGHFVITDALGKAHRTKRFSLLSKPTS